MTYRKTPRLPSSLEPYLYQWPTDHLENDAHWAVAKDGKTLVRDMPETHTMLKADSRWPAFFPSSISLVTTGDGRSQALERVVGASIVNRFPYIMALSFCRETLSGRHYAREHFTELLESTGKVAVQYLPPAEQLDAALKAIGSIPDNRTTERIQATGLQTIPAVTNQSPVFRSAYLVYEGSFARPGHEFEGKAIFREPYLDIGSHRVYFVEINAIQLREDIAASRSQIKWRSLPTWQREAEVARKNMDTGDKPHKYRKSYQPHYSFPGAGTIGFSADEIANGMAIKHLPPLPGDQVQVDNDAARWPCFFPSSAGMITSRLRDGTPNVMPCGSTTVLSRHPMIIAPCISYADINIRYARRASLDLIRENGSFGCGVPYISDHIVNAIIELGNTSISDDPVKVNKTGLAVEPLGNSLALTDLPINYDCKLAGEVRLGTHVMLLGEVQHISVRRDLTPGNPISWCPWAAVEPSA